MNVVHVCGMFVRACVQYLGVVYICLSSVHKFSVYMCVVATECTCMCAVHVSDTADLLNPPPLHPSVVPFVLPISQCQYNILVLMSIRLTHQTCYNPTYFFENKLWRINVNSLCIQSWVS